MDGGKRIEARRALEEHSASFKRDGFRLRELFDANSNRFAELSLCHDGLLFDFSKNLISNETLPLLLELAQQRELPAAIAAMFAGDEINTTERRPARHVALRDSTEPEVCETLARMEKLVDAVHSGRWTGYTGEAITDVVNIGIGGSDLGPALVCDALSQPDTAGPRVQFVSNIDPNHLQTTLLGLNPATTLFVVASKSFSTLETLKNAEAARDWLCAQADRQAIARHFVAISVNSKAALEFGISRENLYPMWDWVGGRFSLWSAIGIPIALALGMDKFRQLLSGAHSMDSHFSSAPLAQNMPVVSALISYWYREFFDAHSTAVVPYSQRLNLLPSYLQQLCMESLGKSVDLEGNPVDYATGDLIWGTAGTNGQHSYFQLLHQGTEFIPVDFIAAASNADESNSTMHQHLLANCLSQSLALMEGSQDGEPAHKHVAGNKPSNTFLLERLDPYTLGMLLAHYEHKVYVLSVLWNINAFDQWGVELGKNLSAKVFDAFSRTEAEDSLDASTAGLLRQIRQWGEGNR